MRAASTACVAGHARRRATAGTASPLSTTSADQLERAIDNLLDLSRLESGLVQPRVRALSLDEVVPRAVAGHPPGAVALELDESLPLVRTDAGLLERVIANLVANASRHSPATGAGARQRVPRGRRVLVVDNGPGVPPEQRERMFEPFQRLGDAADGGLGLGLAVARGLAEAIGGTLTPRTPQAEG